MKRLTDRELERINGGFSTWAMVGIASAIIFISGIIKGIVYPEACKG